jgi:hypothetical protein
LPFSVIFSLFDKRGLSTRVFLELSFSISFFFFFNSSFLVEPFLRDRFTSGFSSTGSVRLSWSVLNDFRNGHKLC